MKNVRKTEYIQLIVKYNMKCKNNSTIFNIINHIEQFCTTNSIENIKNSLIQIKAAPLITAELNLSIQAFQISLFLFFLTYEEITILPAPNNIKI